MKLLIGITVVSLAVLCQGFPTEFFTPGPIDLQSVEPRNLTAKQSCSCGQRRGQGDRIVGGQEAEVNEFPWRVALLNQYSQFFCTASLLDDRFILTAAHCTQAARDHNWAIYVSLGDHDLQSEDDTTNEILRISGIGQHRSYNARTFDNDIAILLMDRSAKLSETVSPVCLPYKYRNTAFDKNEVITASGWGDQEEGANDNGQKLNKVDLRVISNQECSKKYASKGVGITKNMICTYVYDTNSGGKDTCQGDSGGSIDYKDAQTGFMNAIGVVSFGVGCAREDNPGVYARVGNYLDWIHQTTGRRFCGSNA